MYRPAEIDQYVEEIRSKQAASTDSETRLPIEDRKAILQKAILYYNKAGFRIFNQTDTTAQMIKDIKPNLIVFFILCMFFVIPAFLYLFMVPKNVNLYIQVQEDGTVIYG